MFVQINDTLFINDSDIIAIHADYVQNEHYNEKLPDGGYESGRKDVHYVRVVTRAVEEGSSVCHLLRQGTLEAIAILKWANSEPFYCPISARRADRNDQDISGQRPR